MARFDRRTRRIVVILDANAGEDHDLTGDVPSVSWSRRTGSGKRQDLSHVASASTDVADLKPSWLTGSELLVMIVGNNFNEGPTVAVLYVDLP